MDTLDYALDWQRRGASVIPVRADKTPGVAWKPYQRAAATEAQIRQWFTRWPNYGLVCGFGGLLVLDFDDLALWQVWQRAYSVGYHVTTGRGAHVYFYTDQPARTLHLSGVDVLGVGAYVLGAGCVHPSGAVYTAHSGPIPHVADVAPLADRLLSISGGARPCSHPATGATVRPDSGDSPLQRVKARLRAMDLLTTEVKVTGRGWGMACCPLHDDHHPSLSVNLRTGDVCCLAGCAGGRWLDAIGLYCEWHHVTTRQAVYELSADDLRILHEFRNSEIPL
jgi:hypothetical protein